MQVVSSRGWEGATAAPWLAGRGTVARGSSGGTPMATPAPPCRQAQPTLLIAPHLRATLGALAAAAKGLVLVQERTRAESGI